MPDSDDSRPGLDAVEGGPEPSGADDEVERGEPEAAAREHPSVRALEERFPDAVLHYEVAAGGQHVVFVDPERNVEVLRWLKEDPEHHYDLLVDITAVDYGGGRPIQVVYQLWSIPHRRGLRLKCELPLSELEIDTAVPLWEAANWLEREVYDMFGIEFRDHPDLRRILMPESYAEGHPLRKDFPLRGRFSRAEQTRRALTHDPRDHYVPAELEVGGVAERAEGATGERGERRELPDHDRKVEESRDAGS